MIVLTLLLYTQILCCFFSKPGINTNRKLKKLLKTRGKKSKTNLKKGEGSIFPREKAKPLQWRLAIIFQHQAREAKAAYAGGSRIIPCSRRDSSSEWLSCTIPPSTDPHCQWKKLPQHLPRSNGQPASQIRDVMPQTLKLLVQGWKN